MVEPFGTVLTAAQTFSAVRTKRQEYEFLFADMETAKRLASAMRTVAEQVLRLTNLPPSCNLELMVQSYRAFEVFLQNETQGKLNEANMVAYPEWYRDRVARHIMNMQTQYLLYQMERQLYTDLTLHHLLSQRVNQPTKLDGLLDRLVHDVRDESHKCHYFYQGFVKSIENNKDSLCPRCFRPTAGTPTVTEQELTKAHTSQNPKHT